MTCIIGNTVINDIGLKIGFVIGFIAFLALWGWLAEKANPPKYERNQFDRSITKIGGNGDGGHGV